MKLEPKRQRLHLPISSGLLALIALIGLWPRAAKVNQGPRLATSASASLANKRSEASANRHASALGSEIQPELSAVVSLLTHNEYPLASGNEVFNLIGLLLDPAQSFKIRKRAAWQLTNIATPQSFAALRQALLNAPPELRVVIADALGSSGNAQASAILKELLNDQSELVIRAAIRGLAANGNRDAVIILSTLVQNPKQSNGIRTEAAIALGELKSADAVANLVGLIARVCDAEITEALLSGLARFPIDQTRDFFQSYLDSNQTDMDLRVASLEALGQAGGAAAPFLATYLQSEEPEIRGAAAWAIAGLENPGDVSPQLIAQLTVENEPEVRVRLYQALQNQPDFDPGLLSLVSAEQDISAQLAGYQLLARQVARADSALAAHFDEVIVPKLKQVAVSDGTLNERLSSVIALKQASTPEATRALMEISAQSRDSKIVQAAKLK